MPLIHKKSPAAFKSNIRAEMHAGKPQKQAVAIAYSVKRRAEHKKMNHGGEIENCSHCYDDGGGVSNDSSDPHALDQSKASDFVKAYTGGNEAQAAPSNSDYSPPDAATQKSVSDSREESRKQSAYGGGSGGGTAGKGPPKYTLSGYAKGGMIEDGETAANQKEPTRIKPTGTLENYHEKGRNTPIGKMQREQDLKDFKGSMGPKLKGLAEGGEVDDPEIGEDMDSEIHEQLGKELMGAIEGKDHKRIMQGIEACVLSCMNKMKD